MSYVIRGRITGYLCEDCTEPLVGAVVRFYAAAREPVVGRATAAAKDTTVLLTADEATVQSERLLGEAEVGPDGSYAATFETFDAPAVDVDIYCATVPTSKPPKRLAAPLQFHVTTLVPAWREYDDVETAAFDYAVPQRIWCSIRARFGVWVICGHVRVCETKQPVAGVTVHAFDVDWLQDDALGSAVTDAAGHFRIDYLTSDFKRTPFSPLVNIEWVGGPDLYFRIDGPGGTPLLVEPRSEGRTPGRQNVGPCTCVELCLTGVVPSTPPTIPLWTSVGEYSVKPADGAFTAVGTTTSGDLAFTGVIPLDGILPDALSSQAVDYRFLVAALSGGGPVPVDAAHLPATQIGMLEYFEWDTTISGWTVGWTPFFANNPGATVSIAQPPPAAALVVDVNTPIQADGWIAAPRVNNLTPGGAGRFVIGGDSHLALLDTRAYTTETFDLRPIPVETGDTVPATSQSTKPLYAITFEARDATTHAAIGSNSLPTIAFSNMTDTYSRHPYWAGGDVTTTGVGSVGIAEMQVAGGCAEMGDEIHVLFTAYHPYLGQPTIYLEGNPILPPDLTPAVVDGQAASGSAGVVMNTALLAKCAYILWFTAPLLLTSGGGQLPDGLEDHIAFCKQ